LQKNSGIPYRMVYRLVTYSELTACSTAKLYDMVILISFYTIQCIIRQTEAETYIQKEYIKYGKKY